LKVAVVFEDGSAASAETDILDAAAEAIRRSAIAFQPTPTGRLDFGTRRLFSPSHQNIRIIGTDGRCLRAVVESASGAWWEIAAAGTLFTVGDIPQDTAADVEWAEDVWAARHDPAAGDREAIRATCLQKLQGAVEVRSTLLDAARWLGRCGLPVEFRFDDHAVDGLVRRAMDLSRALNMPLAVDLWPTPVQQAIRTAATSG